jgi:hypothetical protein
VTKAREEERVRERQEESPLRFGLSAKVGTGSPRDVPLSGIYFLKVNLPYVFLFVSIVSLGKNLRATLCRVDETIACSFAGVTNEER